MPNFYDLHKTLTVNEKKLTQEEVEEVHNFQLKQLNARTLNDILEEMTQDAIANEDPGLAEFIQDNRETLISEINLTDVEESIIFEAEQDHDGARDRILADLEYEADKYARKGLDMKNYWYDNALKEPFLPTEIQIPFRDNRDSAYITKNGIALSRSEVDAIFNFHELYQDRERALFIMSDILDEIEYRRKEDLDLPKDALIKQLVQSCDDADLFARKYRVSAIESDIIIDGTDYNLGVVDAIRQTVAEKYEAAQKEMAENTPDL